MRPPRSSPWQRACNQGRVRATHQSIHYFVANADWSDDAVLAAVRASVLPVIRQHGVIRALIVDDTRMSEEGQSTRLGSRGSIAANLANRTRCQVAVSLSVANDHASLPTAYRLYLPYEWADDPDRRAWAGVPDEVVFQSKPQIALCQIRAALATGRQANVALADAAYGTDWRWRLSRR